MCVVILLAILVASCAKRPEVTDRAGSPSHEPVVVGMWNDGLVGENTSLNYYGWNGLCNLSAGRQYAVKYNKDTYTRTMR